MKSKNNPQKSEDSRAKAIAKCAKIDVPKKRKECYVNCDAGSINKKQEKKPPKKK